MSFVSQRRPTNHARSRQHPGDRTLPGQGWTRRQLVRTGAALTGTGLAAAGGVMPAQRAAAQATPVASPLASPVGGGDLALRGISYDVGIEWAPGEWSRPTWTVEFVENDIAAIRNDLHCNAITLYGTNAEHVLAAGRIAQEHDLIVWLQPRLVDGSQEATLDQLRAFAQGAAELRQANENVVLNCGCELTVFMEGIIPGETYLERIGVLAEQWQEMPTFIEDLNAFLAEGIAAVREEYDGPISYGAGTWEMIDWSPFDYVGLNHYRNSFTPDDVYLGMLQSAVASGLPVVITEFGCGTFEGAAERGGEAWTIVDFSIVPPQLNGEYVRSEAEQAAELVRLLELFTAEGVHGAFIFTFIEADYPYSPDPMFDLDMASFGVVKVLPPDSGQGYDETGYWEPKEAFVAVGEYYAAAEQG